MSIRERRDFALWSGTVITRVQGPGGIALSFTYDVHGNLSRAARPLTREGVEGVQALVGGGVDGDGGTVAPAEFFGAGDVFGVGVDAHLLERRIDRRLAEIADRRFELLNLSVPGYRPPQQVMALDEGLKTHFRFLDSKNSDERVWMQILKSPHIAAGMTDDAIGWILLSVVLGLAGVVAGFDRRVVNESGVDGGAQTIGWFGFRLKFLQTGRIPNYAFGMALGVVVLAVVAFGARG